MKPYIFKNKKIFNFLSFLFSILILSTVFTSACDAQDSGASLYFSPSNGTYEVGSTFSVKVKLESEETSVNVAGAEINFNNNELEVNKISKTGSIFSLWAEEPTFSNSSGRITFEGGSPDSFKGSAGTIITITFRAKVSSTSNVSFSSGTVLAADGKGTNILESMSGGIYKLKPRIIITKPEAEEEYVPPFTLGVPSAPIIISPTNPNPEKWYSEKNPIFRWDIPEGITAVKTLCGRNPRSAPVVLYSSPISEKKIEDMENGIWYFHCQLKNDYGWGGITHFKFKIDTDSPDPFEIEIEGGNKTTNSRPVLIFNAVDHLSGVDSYEIRSGDAQGETITESEIKLNPYQLPAQTLGVHNIIVKALDKAGNYEASTVEIEILSIEAPTIIGSPSRLSVNDLIVFRGVAVPGAKINVYVEDEDGGLFLNDTQAMDNGVWYFVFGHSMPEGKYKAWAKAINNEGAKSMPSEAIHFSVKKPIFVKIGTVELDYQKTFIVFIGLIIILGLWFLFLRLVLERKRKEFMEEAEKIEQSFEEAFKNLGIKSDKYLVKLEKARSKRELTKEEEQMRKDIEKNLKVAEKFIGKEVKDLLKIIKK